MLASLTMSVVAEIQQLVTPLGDDAEGILQEGDDDQEASNGRQIPRDDVGG